MNCDICKVSSKQMRCMLNITGNKKNYTSKNKKNYETCTSKNITVQIN